MRVGRRGFASACGLVLVLSLLALGWSAASFSGGKADSARSGCGDAGCHGVPGQASAIVAAQLEGVPETYTPGQNYSLTVSIQGGPPAVPVALNQGGFALEVTAGRLQAADDAVTTADMTATHTDVGNDQRSWTLTWIAPDPATGEVTFYVSVNAVNGNGAADPGDQWNQLTMTSAAGTGGALAPGNATGNVTGNGTQPATPPARTPGLGGVEVLLAAAGLAVARRVRASR